MFGFLVGGQDEPEIEHLLEATETEHIDFEQGGCHGFILDFKKRQSTDKKWYDREQNMPEQCLNNDNPQKRLNV